MKKQTKVENRPFFARFLEGQEYPKVKSNVKAGATKPILDLAHTLKYPSDSDEI